MKIKNAPEGWLLIVSTSQTYIKYSETEIREVSFDAVWLSRAWSDKSINLYYADLLETQIDEQFLEIECTPTKKLKPEVHIIWFEDQQIGVS